MMDLLDENELSDISLDFSMEAEDSGIDACEGRRRPIRSVDLESSTESEEDADADDDNEAGENNLLMQHIPYRDRLHFEENDRFGSKKHSKKLLAPKAAEQLERLALMEDTEDEQSIEEVELSASGDDDDSSFMELHIPLKNKLSEESESMFWKIIWAIFCCKSLMK